MNDPLPSGPLFLCLVEAQKKVGTSKGEDSRLMSRVESGNPSA